MTDLEISKALALAIGYEPEDVSQYKDTATVFYNRKALWRTFDYRDWNIIGPIAEKFDCFPYKWKDGTYTCRATAYDIYADTPQKAIALAVIGAKK